MASQATNDALPDVFGESSPRQSPWRRIRGHADIVVVVAIGGGLGSLARYAVTTDPSPAGRFPLSTYLVNVAGCLALGVAGVLAIEVWRPGRYVRPFLAIGVIGGATTFSTLVDQVRVLASVGAWDVAAGYLAATTAGGLLAGWVGVHAVRLVLATAERARERMR